MSDFSVVLNEEILVVNIDASLFQYQADTTTSNAYSDTFSFDVKDEGSLTFGGLTGNVYLTIDEEGNDPPSAVGDNSLTTEYGVSIVFTSANFTTETTPVYSDPEGDSAECLQILTLPTEGVLKNNGVDVVINEEILFTDIDLGLLTYVPNGLNSNTYNVDFDFQIKDSGSGQYTS